ncbi:hypothetical protein [Nitrincola alkalisediminis]|uniref:hypothetical protein n=1 Tax=Nitrincola alkalisediminis TaxID=1366656 RepID=UPI0018768EBA|nr:hypothetical protein [Nitrincola alkalisediminis]
MIESVSHVILLMSSSLAAVWLLKRLRSAEPETHYKVRVFALSSLFVTAYALSHLVLTQGPQQTTLLQMTENLSMYVALPFIATVFLATGQQWHWSMAGWGRWLLGLIAFFELSRAMGYAVLYAHTLSIAILLALFAGSLLFKKATAKIKGLSSAFVASIGLVFFSFIPLIGTAGNPIFFNFALAAFIPLAASALLDEFSKT